MAQINWGRVIGAGESKSIAPPTRIYAEREGQWVELVSLAYQPRKR